MIRAMPERKRFFLIEVFPYEEEKKLNDLKRGGLEDRLRDSRRGCKTSEEAVFLII